MSDSKNFEPGTGSWQDAELGALRAGASLTFREKLQWIEEAERLSESLRQARIHYPAAPRQDQATVMHDAPREAGREETKDKA